eukprot:scaffold2409_cov121-Isochrysis_galbana.AAC.12
MNRTNQPSNHCRRHGARCCGSKGSTAAASKPSRAVHWPEARPTPPSNSVHASVARATQRRRRRPGAPRDRRGITRRALGHFSAASFLLLASKHAITGGDFNCVENSELDIKYPARGGGTYANAGGRTLARTMAECGMIDAFRFPSSARGH